MQRGVLATAAGEIFSGRSVGVEGVRTGEVVFNTSMSGYQEILTDPSYMGQVVVMTSPHIGNYGVTADDDQSLKPHVSGFVMRSISRRDSNWRSEGSVADFLQNHNIVAISDIDTRRLTRHIRDAGSMPVAIGAEITDGEAIAMAQSAPQMQGRDLASVVSTDQPYRIDAPQKSDGLIVAIDLGMKSDIGNELAGRGFDVQVVPSRSSPSQILEFSPDAVFISNGPGDPEPLHQTVETLRGLIGRLPIFGICLGHQVLGLALGATTYKLPFGHHGGNHPVKRISDGRVEITAQNHGFAVDLWSLSDTEPPQWDGKATPDLLPASVSTDFGEVQPTHQNLNDGTLEGIRMLDAPLFAVQYHPEAAPGPHDAEYLFDDFATMIRAEG